MRLVDWDFKLCRGKEIGFRDMPMGYVAITITCPQCHTIQEVESPGSEISQDILNSPERRLKELVEDVSGDRHCEECRVVSDLSPATRRYLTSSVRAFIDRLWLEMALTHLGCTTTTRRMDGGDEYTSYEVTTDAVVRLGRRPVSV